MILTIYAEKIFYYRGAIADSSALVADIEASDASITDHDVIEKWHKWVSSAEGDDYVFGDRKLTREHKLETSSNNVASIYRTLKSALTKAGMDYASQLGIEYVEPNAISISKYRVGASMGPHVDYYGEPDIQPLMSAIIYLNDDYEGGELYFPEQGVTIKPEAGSVVVFPSVEPFYHEPLPVTSGTKYMSPAFWIKKLS